jgi:hypothetical protein
LRKLFRKSAGQTLFSTIAAHGSLLAKQTWQAVLWQVLFPLLDKVRKKTQLGEDVTSRVLIRIRNRPDPEMEFLRVRSFFF